MNNKNDTKDNKLSKNVRPIIAAFCIICIFLFTALDSINAIGFDVPAHWVQHWKFIIGAVISFYFGSRGFEKIMKIWKQ